MALSIVLLVIALCAVAYVAYRRDIARSFRRVAVGSDIIETRCGPIEYAVAGEGPPVLVVHGAGGGFDQGMGIAGELAAEGYRVVAPSRFGYLRTPLPENASAEAQADAHACLLDALNIPRAAVIGASAGAPSAMQFALRHPERISALVLLVPAAYVPRAGNAPPLQRSRAAVVLAEILLRSDFLFWAALKIAPKVMTRAVLGTPPKDVMEAPASERARVEMMMQHILPASLRRIGLLNDAKVVTTLTRYELEKIAAPTLILAVENDLYGTYEPARYCAEHIPNAQFISAPTGGHLGVGHHHERHLALIEFLSRKR